MSERPRYPEAKRLSTVDRLHDRLIADPYRWLEDPSDPGTVAWSAAQDALLASHQNAWTARAALHDRIAELLVGGDVYPPYWHGDRAFYLRRGPGQEHPVVHTVDPDGTERVLVDPTAVDPTGTTTLDGWWPSIEGDRLAYLLSTGGTERSELWVIDVATGTIVDGPIDRLRYPPVAWLAGATAFYYVRHLGPDADVDEPTLHRRVYLHRVGQPAEHDVLIFGADRPRGSYFDVRTADNGRLLTLTAHVGTDPRNDAWVAEVATDPEHPELRVVQTGVDARALPTFRTGHGDRCLLYTDRDAPWGRICVTAADAPGHESWRDLIPERPGSVLRDFVILDGAELPQPLLAVTWHRHAVSELTLHDLVTGTQLSTVDLPGLGSVGPMTGRPVGGSEVWFRYTDYATPTAVHRYDAVGGTLDVWARSQQGRPRVAVTTRQLEFRSADGTEVRMFVIGQPDDAGPRPTVLYGYGGFAIPIAPVYAAEVVAWIEAGGVYAEAGIRGGAEEGEAWHRAGMLGGKQNVFDDFQAAARCLIERGITTADQLGIMGGSNGGLLVGAALTQRPDLFAAVVCSAPLLDMVRYEQFGLGSTWAGEYGTASDPEEFEWLYAYSPYHHVKSDVDYPAVLFTVFEGDSRVDPLHARKLAAALQHATAGARPILLRRESDVGHGSRSISRSVNLLADEYAFLAHHLGLTPPPGG